jgi:hypothetical protein
MGSSNKIAALLIACAMIVAPLVAAADGEKKMSARQACAGLSGQIDDSEGTVPARDDCAMTGAPVVAAADGEKKMRARQSCARLSGQIDHFEGTVLKMAQERDDALWEESTEKHVKHLRARRASLCPQYAEEERILARARAEAERMRQLMVSAAKGAAKYFSGGWY